MRSSPSIPLVLALALVACARTAPEPEAGDRVENGALGLALASVPAPFDVAENEGPALVLASTRPDDDGRVRFRVGRSQANVNLVAAAEAQGAGYEERPEGKYHGSLELMTPWGSAYYARGSWQDEGARLEETTVFALHPMASDRLLAVAYLYPAGEGQTRIHELFAVVGEIEGTGVPEWQDEPPSDSGAPDSE